MLPARPSHLHGALAAALAAGALAAPAVQAGPIREEGSGYAGEATGLVETEPADAGVATTTTVDEGFDLGSAAIGAGGVVVAVALGAGAFALAVRRRGGVVQ